MTHAQAAQAVEAIVEDLRDRRGLANEWGEIDRGVQQEIKAAWAHCIMQPEAARSGVRIVFSGGAEMIVPCAPDAVAPLLDLLSSDGGWAVVRGCRFNRSKIAFMEQIPGATETE